MKKHIPQLVLLILFILRVLLPVTNAIVLWEASLFENSELFEVLFIVSILAEITITAVVGKGLRSPKARRVGAYLTLSVSALHFPALAALYLIIGGYYDGVLSIWMLLGVIVYATMVTLAFMTLRTVDEMPAPERKALSPKEINVRVESLHSKLNNHL